MLHRGKSKLKVEFDIHVQRITGLDNFVGSAIYVCWKRDTRKKGMTRRAMVTDAVAVFDEHIIFSGTLFTNNAGVSDKKKLELEVRNAGSSVGEDSRVLLHTKVDLSELSQEKNEGVIKLKLDYAKDSDKSDGSKRNRFLPGLGGKEDSSLSSSTGPKPILEATFTLHKMTGDGKVVPHNTSSESVAKEHVGKTIVLGGETTKTETEASADAGSADDWDGDTPGGDDEKTVAQLRKEIERLEFENKQQQLTISELQRQIRELKQQQKFQGSSAGGSSGNLSDVSGSPNPKATPGSLKNPKTREKRLSVGLSFSQMQAVMNSGGQDVSSGVDSPRRQKSLVQLQRTTSFAKLHTKNNGSVSSALFADASSFAQLKSSHERLVLVEREIYRCQPQIVDGVPVTATSLWGALEEWNVFPTGNVDLIKALVKAISAASDVLIGNAPRLAYWSSTIIWLLKESRKMNISGDDSLSDDEKRVAEETVQMYDALLTNLLFALYKMLVSNMIHQMKPFVVPVVLHSNAAGRAGSSGSSLFSDPADLLIHVLNDMHSAMVQNCVDHEFASQVYAQTAYVLSAMLFNYLLRHSSECNADTGLQMIMAMAPLCSWVDSHKYTKATEELNLAQEIARLLTTKKDNLADSEFLRTLCPSMSLSQVRAIASLCPDTPKDVIAKLSDMDDHKNETTQIQIDEEFVNRLSYDFLNEQKK